MYQTAQGHLQVRNIEMSKKSFTATLTRFEKVTAPPPLPPIVEKGDICLNAYRNVLITDIETYRVIYVANSPRPSYLQVQHIAMS